MREFDQHVTPDGRLSEATEDNTQTLARHMQPQQCHCVEIAGPGPNTGIISFDAAAVAVPMDSSQSGQVLNDRRQQKLLKLTPESPGDLSMRGMSKSGSGGHENPPWNSHQPSTAEPPCHQKDLFAAFVLRWLQQSAEAISWS